MARVYHGAREQLAYLLFYLWSATHEAKSECVVSVNAD
jgi:hypothetical protein